MNLGFSGREKIERIEKSIRDKSNKKTKINIEMRICSFSCDSARAEYLPPECRTINPIYCSKHKKIMQKGSTCLDYTKSLSYY